MKRSGAELVRQALEALGVRYSFGIPGVHNTEIYDQLAASPSIEPVLVAHEGGGAFMADAVSRVGGAGIGTLLIVPAAGVTHAASGIGEAFLDGIPMLVLSGGIRRDTGRRFQLHDVDQHALLRPITKGTWLPRSHAEIVPAIFAAHALATEGEPGPVYVEVPVDLQLFTGDPGVAQEPPPPIAPPLPPATLLDAAAALLARAARPGILCGWGAVGASAELEALAERLGAPVATTLQGLSTFRADHPLHAAFALGPSSTPAGVQAFAECDCLLAVGTRFAEIATGSYGARVPSDLVHVDINPAAIGANYPARVGLVGDARPVLAALLGRLGTADPASYERGVAVAAQIAADKRAYQQEWFAHDSRGRVNPARFFAALRSALPRDAIIVADDGNHTFLTAELLPILEPRTFLSPTDFNCMGYCIPATIGAKLARPERTVVGIVGDGALRMTGLEALTAAARAAGIAWFVFSDGELSQISQAQEIPLNRKTCSVLSPLDVVALARAVGAGFVAIGSDAEVAAGIAAALAAVAGGRPVFVDVRIDYSKRTRFTSGTVRTTLERFDRATRLRFVGRALWRRFTG
ncbi:MAG: thiamine pyrophosphate-binding protein [Proteobacteria bacterium]|nr:thiamine pyrophosphate-binding protein [Pseudomonadota bacterium]